MRRDSPTSRGFELKAVRRFPDYRSELCEQQPENGLALAFAAAQVWVLVIPVGAGGAGFGTAP